MRIGILAIIFSITPTLAMLYVQDLYGFLGFFSASLGWTVAYLLCKRIEEIGGKHD